MKRALFKSANLIGDGLCSSAALRAWHREHMDWDIDLLTNADHVAVIYPHMGVPLNVITDEKELRRPYDFEFMFDPNEAFKIGHESKVHLIDAYARMLGVKAEEMTPTFQPEEEEHPKGLCLISPFSRSCASQSGLAPNKMLPWPVWLQVLTILRCYGDVGVLGGPKDRAALLPLAENEYYCGYSLNQVALMLRDAKVLVTIDNGMAHLAASQGTKTFEFYPACLGLHWVAPRHKAAFVVQVDPGTLDYAALPNAVRAVRVGLRHLLDGME